MSIEKEGQQLVAMWLDQKQIKALAAATGCIALDEAQTLRLERAQARDEASMNGRARDFAVMDWTSREKDIRKLEAERDALKSEVANLQMDRDFWRDRAQCGGSDEARAVLAYVAEHGGIDHNLVIAYRASIAKPEKKPDGLVPLGSLKPEEWFQLDSMQFKTLSQSFQIFGLPSPTVYVDQNDGWVELLAANTLVRPVAAPKFGGGE